MAYSQFEWGAAVRLNITRQLMSCKIVSFCSFDARNFLICSQNINIYHRTQADNVSQVRKLLAVFECGQCCLIRMPHAKTQLPKLCVTLCNANWLRVGWAPSICGVLCLLLRSTCSSDAFLFGFLQLLKEKAQCQCLQSRFIQN